MLLGSEEILKMFEQPKEKKRKVNKETIILRQIRDYLKIKGWYVIRIQQNIGCHKGISDLIAIKDGQVVFIEVKTEKGKQSDYQVKFQFEIEQHGGQYIIARSIEDVNNL